MRDHEAEAVKRRAEVGLFDMPEMALARALYISLLSAKLESLERAKAAGQTMTGDEKADELIAELKAKLRALEAEDKEDK
jgi:hypothetical protein